MDLMPNKTIDIFYERIKNRLDNKESVERELERIKKVNAGIIPEKIKKLIDGKD